MTVRTMRVRDVARMVGLSAPTIWRFVQQDLEDFPKPFKLSPGVTVWYEHEIEAWLASRPRSQPKENVTTE